MNNKKGQFLAIGLFVIAAILLTFIIIFPKVRFILIGVTLFIAFFTILVKGDINKTKGIILGILFISSIFFMFGSGVLQSTFSTTITPVFCNDYEFTCCGGIKGLSSAPQSIWQNSPRQCDVNAIKCRLENLQLSTGNSVFCGSNLKVMVGSKNCKVVNPLIGVKYFKCDDERVLPYGSEYNPGDYIWLQNVQVAECSGNAYVSSWNYKLGFCGRSGAGGEEVSCGTSVSGADKCTFTPTGSKLYSLIGSPISTTSYTVPLGQCVLAFQSGDRHICGYKEETCSQNSDCNGHTYGTKECSGRTLQTYGCKSFGTTIVSEDRLAGIDADWSTSDALKTSANTFGKRCEIISAETVQCCGDTDCGTNAFCDKTSFTCKDKVECTTNTDCGVSTTCDYTTKTVKSPICNSLGKCAFKETAVDCCLDVNCPVGYYCSADKKCEQQVAVKQPCAFECCENEQLYIDKSCTSSAPYCIENQCKEELVIIDGGNQTLSCKFYQEPYTKEVKDWGTLGWRHIFNNPLTHAESGCKTTGWVYFVIGIFAVLILIISIILIKSKPKKKEKRK